MLWWQLLEDGVVELGRRVEPERWSFWTSWWCG